MREKLAELPARSDAVGRTPAITGGLTVERGTDGTLRVTELSFEADLLSLRSDESRRDNRIKELGLESATYPTATFVAASPIDVPPGLSDGETVRAEVEGDLRIHGVTNRVTIPVEARLSGSQVEVVGAYTFPFTEFGMDPPSIPPFVTVDDEATMEVKLVLAKQDS